MPSRNIGCTAGSAGISDKLSQVHLGTLLGAPVPWVLHQLGGNDNPGPTDETGGDARAGKRRQHFQEESFLGTASSMALGIP